MQPVLFIGETLVDLTCERPVSDWAEIDAFVPHCGGAPTNAAIVAARCGAPVALGGGVGDDQWGRWLEARLVAERVDLRWWSLLPGVRTAVAFVAIDGDAVPDFLIYGEGIEPALVALEPRLEEAVAASCAVELGSNTFVGERERAVSARARELALGQGKPVVVDVNLRLHRWADAREAVEVVRAFCTDALLVKVSGEEARLLSGESDAAQAADALCASLHAQVVVVTLGGEGALVRGAVRSDVDGVLARVVDTTGAGDAVTGVLVAALAAAGFEPAAVAGALPRAVAIAARSTEAHGALEALPVDLSAAADR
ncbi:MAG TPA: PfkB family carbohydrate kinase [Gaiellaceae bacterium]|nr:PfkB family carbohydrate kinase [Gaiellaceae bacterium]